jgi:septal ring-binding cell division protein DamX
MKHSVRRADTRRTTGGLGLQEAEIAYAALLKRKGRVAPDAKKAKAAPAAKTPAKSPASAAKGKVRLRAQPSHPYRAQLFGVMKNCLGGSDHEMFHAKRRG